MWTMRFGLSGEKKIQYGESWLVDAQVASALAPRCFSSSKYTRESRLTNIGIEVSDDQARNRKL